MHSLDIKVRRRIGLCFLGAAILIPILLWFTAGQDASLISTSPSIILVIFAILFLTGRGPNSSRSSRRG